MKKIIITLASLLFLFTACSFESSDKETVVIKKSDIFKTNLKVGGMTCKGCEANLEKSLKHVKGVVSVDASYSGASTVVEFDKTKTSLEEIFAVIQKKGYDVQVKE